jgi:hypothetical protein
VVCWLGSTCSEAGLGCKQDKLEQCLRSLAALCAAGVGYDALLLLLPLLLLLLLLQERKRNMTWLAQQRQQHLQLFGERVHDMGSFIENHGVGG